MRRIAQTLGRQGTEPHRDNGSRDGEASKAPSSVLSAPRAGHPRPTSALRRGDRSPRSMAFGMPGTCRAWGRKRSFCEIITVRTTAFTDGINVSLPRR
jgi:hypothetical protein